VNFIPSLASLEEALSEFSPEKRKRALLAICDHYSDELKLTESHKGKINLHAHTFFSYNAYGHSPTALAWIAKKKGLDFIGIVDFDVLDGVNEFLEACELLCVRGVAGMETRVFIPEYRNIEINSPGQPGIAYHMGAGFTDSDLTEMVQPAFNSFRTQAAERNYDIVQKLNAYLNPLSLDFEAEVLPLSPKGNVTERHIVYKLIEKSFDELDDTENFWQKKLKLSADRLAGLLNDRIKFEQFLRKKMIKRGGVAYITPDPEKFPTISEFNRIIRSAGAIPCMAWLDGTSEGENDIERLLGFMIDKGVCAVNIIPDRNWNLTETDVKTRKIEALYKFVDLADEQHLPILIGTEMNSNGQKLVDDLNVPELAPLADSFRRGAEFIYGHTMLERLWGLGYQSAWAQKNFKNREKRNTFYTEVGKVIPPGVVGKKIQKQISNTVSPEKLLHIFNNRNG